MERTAGIYVIRNQITGAEYIGSSNNVNRRWNDHQYRLQRNINGTPHLQNSWNKYGEKAFVFDVLEETIDLENRELFWINQRKPTLNCKTTIVRKNPDGLGFVHSVETRQKISVTLSGVAPSKETRKKISDALKGRPKPPRTEEHQKKISMAKKGTHWSEEARKNISDARKGKGSFKGKHHSEGTCKKISDALKGKPNPFKGKHHSEETKRKLSKALIGHHSSIETRQKISEGAMRMWQKRKSENAPIAN